MNQSRIWAGGVLLAAMFTVIVWVMPAEGQGADRQASMPAAGLQMGRFQLYQGSFELRTENNHASTGLFKIDTANGRVWKYDEVPSDPPRKITAKWQEVEQF